MTWKTRRVYKHGVFCLEGDWWPDLKNPASVEPVLRLLSESHISRVPYIYRDVGTAEDFKYYLEKWTQTRYAEYPILYLGFHGVPGKIVVGDKRRKDSHVTLDNLEDWLSGSCAKRVIHFGSCETMNVSATRLQAFLKATGALALLGYRKIPEWIESAAFETLLLGELQYNAMSRSGLKTARERVKERLGGCQLLRELGFRMEIRE
ncbi:MAG: DUF6642 family protein [Candidatus Hydrogenedentales bacterium]